MPKKVYVEVTVKRKPTSLVERMELAPWPEKTVWGKGCFAFPSEFQISGLAPARAGEQRTFESLRRFLDSLSGVRLTGNEGAYPLRFRLSSSVGHPEGYRLSLTGKGVEIRARTPAGLFYGAQTLIQLLGCSFYPRVILGSHAPAEEAAFEKRWIPEAEIEDAPRYELRSFMIDLGRAPWSMALIKRTIRIMSHLKLNVLHLHLLDDQLGGLRFNRLPLGSENPYAISMADLADLVRYARGFHVAILPELESWGHTQSVIYHYPELYGGPGMWGGMSLGIGERTYALLEKMYDEVVEVLEPEAMLHAGLDEALWRVLPGDEKAGHTPVTMVRRIHDLLQRAAARHKKKVSLHLWADHGGRPLPPDLKSRVVIEPWKYRQTDEKEIVKALRQYGGRGKSPCMMGAGWSSAHFQGSYEATRIWCREGAKYPNILGVTNCFWESNNLSGQMVGLYGGACYSWNPALPANTDRDPIYEDLRNAMVKRMRHWQIYFNEADAAAVDLDRGPEVYQGRYMRQPLAGEAVAPTLEWRHPSSR